MTDREAIAAACRAHGIDDTFTGIDGVTRDVPTGTLVAMAGALRIAEAEPTHFASIQDVLHEEEAPRAFVPEALRDARGWGLTCQLGSLRSARNWGMGDFADLATLVRSAAAMGADFVGLNPLHELFAADQSRASPFSPSNRLFLNPAYIAPDLIEGFERLPAQWREPPAGLRESETVDLHRVRAAKRAAFGALFDAYPWTDALRREFDAFRRLHGTALHDDALFNAISSRMVSDGFGAGWTQWPEPYRDRNSIDVRAFEEAEAGAVVFFEWLQWQADRQLARAAAAAREAGMRVGLYLDLAVGAAPDGSATWSDPALTVPGLHVGAPPDPFSATGQDWGLAPTNPVALASRDAQPIAEMMGAVMRHAGAVRIDHAMGLARLWLIPAGRPSLEGAYVRYPLSRTLRAVADVSNRMGCMVIGEDLGVVPDGFRPLMERHDLHAYKVFLFEREGKGFRDPTHFTRTALACVGTHDTPSFPGWWAGRDIELRREIGWLDAEAASREEWHRGEEREEVHRLVGHHDAVETSVRVHAHVARSPCRLMAVQLDDALGTLEQPNLPGTIDEHPNWRRKMSVTLEEMEGHEDLARHCEAMRRERPRG